MSSEDHGGFGSMRLLMMERRFMVVGDMVGEEAPAERRKARVSASLSVMERLGASCDLWNCLVVGRGHCWSAWKSCWRSVFRREQDRRVEARVLGWGGS